MVHQWLPGLVFCLAIPPLPLMARELYAQDPIDLHGELRSATGSNQIGEQIPLEVATGIPFPFTLIARLSALKIKATDCVLADAFSRI